MEWDFGENFGGLVAVVRSASSSVVTASSSVLVFSESSCTKSFNDPAESPSVVPSPVHRVLGA